MAGTDIYQAEPDHKWTGDATIHPLKNVVVLHIMLRDTETQGWATWSQNNSRFFWAIADNIGKELPYQCISQYTYILCYDTSIVVSNLL